MTKSEILTELQVTPEQLDRCTRLIDLNVVPAVVFYRVKSESEPTTTYEVRHSAERGFTCTCKSGKIAFSNVYNKFRVCKHCRWSIAYERLWQAEQAERRAQAEAAEQAAYQNEQQGQAEPTTRLEHLIARGLTAEQAEQAVNSHSDQPDEVLARVYGASPKPQAARKGELSSNQGFSLMR